MIQIRTSSIKYWLFVLVSITVDSAETTNREAQLQHLKKCSANFTIAGMFSLHDDRESTRSTCVDSSDKLNPYGLLESLAMIYAVITVNENEALLPGIPIAIDLSDSCKNVNAVVSNYLDLDFVRDFYEEHGNLHVDRPGHVFSIIGSTTTAIGISLSTLSNVFNVPVVSHFATSPVLSNKDRYRTFFRTIPSDKLLIEAMLELLEKSNWHVITVIHTKTDYAASAFSLLLSEIKKRQWKEDQLCIAGQHAIRNANNQSELDVVFDKLQNDIESNVIVTLAHFRDGEKILERALQRNFTRKVWILSSGIQEARKSYCKGSWQTLSNKVITSLARQGDISQFQDFVQTNLLNTTNSKLVDLLPIRKQDIMSMLKDEKEILWKIPVTVPYVIDAVTATAHALHKTLRCDQGKCMDFLVFNRSALIQNLYTVNFTSQLGEVMQFDEHGDTKGSFVFRGFSNDVHSCTFYDIAEWRSDGTKKGLQWLNDSIAKKTISKCTENCTAAEGFVKSNAKKGCCWTCKRCTGNGYASSETGACEQCSERETPDAKNSKCIPLKMDRFNFTNSTPGLIVLSLSGIGLVLVVFISITFYIYRDTHIVRASNKEMTCLLLIGIALGYITPLVATTAKGVFQCCFNVYINGISISLMTGSLFAKANRMYRIFRKKVMRGGSLAFMTVRFQLFTVFIFVAIEIILSTVIVLNPNKPVRVKEVISKVQKSIWVVCHSDLWMRFAAEFVGLSLTFLCTYQAFLARKVPGEYNDSRSILAVTLIMSLQNIVCISLLFSGHFDSISQIAASLPGLLSATVLVCLFCYKVYILLCQPHLNTISMPHGGLGTFDSTRRRAPFQPRSTISTDIGIANFGAENSESKDHEPRTRCKEDCIYSDSQCTRV